MTRHGDAHPESSRETRDQELFERIAGQYTAKDLHGGCRLARRHRVQATLGVISLPAEPDLLEVGCGAGFSAEHLRGQFGSYTGIDYSKRLIHEARARHESEGVTFLVADGMDFVSPRPFDAVFMIGVLHHVPDRDRLIGNLLPSLKPRGWLVANEPQPNNPLIRGARRLRGRIDKSYSAEQEQLSVDHLTALFQSHGLGSIRTRWQGYLSTPFAEVPLRPERIFAWAARVAVWSDRVLERSTPRFIARGSWNCIVAGQKPSPDPPTDRTA